MRRNQKLEKFIEADILEFLTLKGLYCWKNDIKGYYNSKKGVYQRNSSNFIRRGISDIGCLYKGIFIAIEVKKEGAEMKFHDRSIQELQKELEEKMTAGKIKDPKKYIHAIEQVQYIEDVKNNGGIGFFTSSITQTVEKLSENNIII